MPEQQYASPFEYAEQTSQFSADDMDVTVVEATTEHFKFPNTPEDYGTAACLYLKLQTDDGTEYEEHVSAGTAKTWDVDGKGFIPTGEKNQITKTTAMGILGRSIMDSGFKVSADEFNKRGWKVLEGQRFHIQQVPVKDHQGNPKYSKSGYARTTPTFSKYLDSSSGNPATTQSFDGGDEGALVKRVTELLDHANGSLDRNELVGQLAAAPGYVDPGFAASKIMSDKWLSDQDAWSYSDGILKKK